MRPGRRRRLWPELEDLKRGNNSSEVMAFYPHRSETPKHLWLDLLIGARERIDLVAYASLFLPEENPDAIEIIAHKARSGVPVRVALGDPGSPEVELRGREERLHEALTGRVRMALAYYRPLFDVPEIEFHLHRTTLYNSIFRYDDQMLINQHVYGTYGYVAPILHLLRPVGQLFSVLLVHRQDATSLRSLRTSVSSRSSIVAVSLGPLFSAPRRWTIQPRTSDEAGTP